MSFYPHQSHNGLTTARYYVTFSQSQKCFVQTHLWQALGVLEETLQEEWTKKCAAKQTQVFRYYLLILPIIAAKSTDGWVDGRRQYVVIIPIAASVIVVFKFPLHLVLSETISITSLCSVLYSPHYSKWNKSMAEHNERVLSHERMQNVVYSLQEDLES